MLREPGLPSGCGDSFQTFMKPRHNLARVGGRVLCIGKGTFGGGAEVASLLQVAQLAQVGLQADARPLQVVEVTQFQPGRSGVVVQRLGNAVGIGSAVGGGGFDEAVEQRPVARLGEGVQLHPLRLGVAQVRDVDHEDREQPLLDLGGGEKRIHFVNTSRHSRSVSW